MSPIALESSKQQRPVNSNFDLARVRDNQRRSRARRKEYLQELETKLRHCEILGVQANVETQNAAKIVYEENDRLRAENTRLREENERLGQMLRARDEPDSAVTAEGARLGTLDMEGLGFGRTFNGVRARVAANEQVRASEEPKSNFEAAAEVTARAPLNNDNLPQSTTEMHHTSNIPRTSSGHTRPIARGSSTEEAGMYSTYGVPSQCDPANRDSCLKFIEEVSKSDDSSSCEYAAHIITSMRADISTDDVRADLGCGNNPNDWRKCKIDNSTLFNAVDRYAG